MKRLLTLKKYAFYCTTLEMAFLMGNKVHGIGCTYLYIIYITIYRAYHLTER